MFGNLGVSACGGNLKYYLLHIIEHCNMTWEESCANFSADIQIAEDGCLLLAIIRKGHSNKTEIPGKQKITKFQEFYDNILGALMLDEVMVGS